MKHDWSELRDTIGSLRLWFGYYKFVFLLDNVIIKTDTNIEPGKYRVEVPTSHYSGLFY